VEANREHPDLCRRVVVPAELKWEVRDKLPVHIGYWTAWVEPDGSVTYTQDPYGFDPIHAKLRAASASARS
jgi:murein L,D-transpeptidase YcbB/YkuD